MNRFFVFLTLIFSIFFFSCHAIDLGYDGKQEDPEMEALKKWIQNKRLVTVKEIGGDLSFSGEVRTEMQAASERKDGVDQRGLSGATIRPTFAYDVEFNLMMDYRSERTWASVKIEFDNDMGVVTGSTGRLALERAYLGGRVVPGETFIMDMELGRRNLGNIYDSKIQYSSVFDGILVKLNKSFESIGNFYLNTGAFLVNDRKHHYGYVSELGMLRIKNTGLFTKYSVIDWKKHYTNSLKNRSFHFINSQLIIGYQGEVPRWKKFLKVYFGGLVNHAAMKRDLTNNKRANLGGYCGFSVGQLRKKGDWALDTNYQIVQAQAVPDFDSGGIKRGNAAGTGFYSTGRYGLGDPTTKETAVGGGNFKGWSLDFLYGITNNLTVQQSFQMSRTLDSDIGPLLKFYQYEIEFIYAF